MKTHGHVVALIKTRTGRFARILTRLNAQGPGPMRMLDIEIQKGELEIGDEVGIAVNKEPQATIKLNPKKPLKEQLIAYAARERT